METDYLQDYLHKVTKHTWNFNHGVEHGVKQGRDELQAEIDKETEEIQNYKNFTTKRRAEFEALNLEKVNYVKSLLLVVYGLLVLWFIYVMYKNTDLKRQQKGLLVGGLVAFPFIAPVLLIYLYEMFAYIVALMTGEIYKKAELQ
jgi:hypothetical protein